MEQIEMWQKVVTMAFPACLFCIALVAWKWQFGFLAPVFFMLFIYGAINRDKAVFANLDELGCVYFGSGKKGQPHVPPTKFYKCPDGIVRSQ